MTEPFDYRCSECGAKEQDDEDDYVYLFGCSRCPVTICEACAANGMCMSCDVDTMAGVDEEE